MSASPSPITDLSKLCVHTITTKPWSLEQAVDHYAQAGIKGITVWRDALNGRDIAQARRNIAEAGLSVVSLCRGGFFPATAAPDRQKALDDNKKAIDEAAALGAPHIVLVCGAVPGMPLPEARAQIRNGIEQVLPYAQDAGVKLSIEPLHPMYADDRSAISTLKQANDLCEQVNSSHLGVTIDVYHLWWDDTLEAEIKRSGASGFIDAFHICDWKTPTSHLLFDRGLMGEGCIDIRQIRGWVEAAGFNGFNEVEIFSERYWSQDQTEFLSQITQAYLNHS